MGRLKQGLQRGVSNGLWPLAPLLFPSERAIKTFVTKLISYSNADEEADDEVVADEDVDHYAAARCY